MEADNLVRLSTVLSSAYVHISMCVVDTGVVVNTLSRPPSNTLSVITVSDV